MIFMENGFCPVGDRLDMDDGGMFRGLVSMESFEI
jgi:hypothetical protein